MLSYDMQELKNSLSCITYNGAQHAHIMIEETDSRAKLKKVTIQIGNGDWFSFSPDEGRKCKKIHDKCRGVEVMSPLLATKQNNQNKQDDNQHMHHRACDCVLVVNKDTQLTLVYIDLKSSNPNGYANQFKSTRQFMRYALGLLEEFHHKKLTIAHEHYVILYGGQAPSINKQPTVSRGRKKSKPDDAHKLEVTNNVELYLKQLIDS